MNIQEYISSGIIELYVMGLCTPEEEKQVEDMRRLHPEIHQAIISYEAEVESKMLKNGVLPSASVDERIIQKLESLKPPGDNKHVLGPAVIKMKPRTSGWWKVAAAAALVLFIASSYFNYDLYQKNKKLEKGLAENKGAATLPASDYSIITNPAITPVAMYGVGTHSICRCTMFWDKKTGKMYIMIHHLPQSSEVKDYQLWAEVDGKPVSVGIINDKIRGRFIEITDVPLQSTAFTVTLEPAGGSQSPTVSETYLAGRI